MNFNLSLKKTEQIKGGGGRNEGLECNQVKQNREIKRRGESKKGSRASDKGEGSK